MNTTARIFDKDSSVWSDDLDVRKSIDNRLGWLDAIEFSRDNQAGIDQFVAQVQQQGFQQVILIGMGGSCLAPEVFSHLFAEEAAGLELLILDSTCVEQILAVRNSVDLKTSLFVISSKSGGTIETRYLFRYFYQQLIELQGDAAGQQFVAITDGGSELEQLALNHNFMHCFVNPSDIGGRFSALSYFGLVPAALMGVSLERLLDRAQQALDACLAGQGAGVQLGEWLVAQYQSEQVDKLIIQVPALLEPLVWWIEQLVAESLGKQGQGVMPVLNSDNVDKPFAMAKTLHMNIGESKQDFSDKAHAYWNLQDKYDVASQFFHWEFATALAGAYININPFDEPNVTEAKQQTKKLLEQSITKELVLPEEQPLASLWSKAEADSYVAVLAYWPITDGNDQVLRDFRLRIEALTGLPVSVNYGPRYLHSTGQLHKGGKRQGLFIVLTQADQQELPIPGQAYTFNTLCRAQALGDFQILCDKGLPAVFYCLESSGDDLPEL